jgi:hypothetical protein
MEIVHIADFDVGRRQQIGVVALLVEEFHGVRHRIMSQRAAALRLRQSG